MGGGAVLQGTWGKPPQDSIGIAATDVRLSSQPAAGFETGSELVLESYYKAFLTRHSPWYRIFNSSIIPADRSPMQTARSLLEIRGLILTCANSRPYLKTSSSAPMSLRCGAVPGTRYVFCC